MKKRFVQTGLLAVSLILCATTAPGTWAEVPPPSGGGVSNSSGPIPNNLGNLLLGVPGGANQNQYGQTKPAGTGSTSQVSPLNASAGNLNPASPSAASSVQFDNGAVTLTGNGGGGSSVGGIGGNITVGNIKGLDLETAMMAIQSQRANLLEGQLKTQMDSLVGRNDQIATLNSTLGNLGQASKSSPPEFIDNLIKALKDAGIDMTTGMPSWGSPEYKVAFQDKLFNEKNQDFRAKVAEQIKGKIDSLNSSQQMDMLRMQSLTNKRNEAFDLMTNFIKKMADSRSSVLGNMR